MLGVEGQLKRRGVDPHLRIMAHETEPEPVFELWVDGLAVAILRAYSALRRSPPGGAGHRSSPRASGGARRGHVAEGNMRILLNLPANVLQFVPQVIDVDLQEPGLGQGFPAVPTRPRHREARQGGLCHLVTLGVRRVERADPGDLLLPAPLADGFEQRAPNRTSTGSGLSASSNIETRMFGRSERLARHRKAEVWLLWQVCSSWCGPGCLAAPIPPQVFVPTGARHAAFELSPSRSARTRQSVPSPTAERMPRDPPPPERAWTDVQTSAGRPDRGIAPRAHLGFDYGELLRRTLRASRRRSGGADRMRLEDFVPGDA